MTIIKFIFLLFSIYSHIRNIISLDFYCISKKKKNKKKIELQVSVLTCLTLFLVFNCYSETSAFSGGSDMNSSPTTYQSRASLVAQLVKNLPAMQETPSHPGSISGLGRSSGEGISYPLQYSWASQVAQIAKNLPKCRRTGFDPWVRKIPWKRSWQPTLVFLPGESHGQRSLAGYSSWGHKELESTE